GVAENTGPLTIYDDVAVKATPTQGSCGTAFTFVATGTLRGVGKLVYRWERSDGGTSPDESVDITSDEGSFRLQESWKILGPHSPTATMTFHILRPSTKTASASVSYTCA
ncbi:MAG TPA: hypothetical protein VE219_04595, partial [Candidatus Sulfotelmatobacter sp.]|nr:hypothetical protein [Candidatus Sulfotelmatobacter sp.]